MKRQVIKINEELCNGCGLCADACHEGAIDMVNGKAKLLRDDYCDGLGDCLPVCPINAISFEVREAAAYDEEAVKLNAINKEPMACGCPGTNVTELKHNNKVSERMIDIHPSELRQWPVQIKLVPVHAPYFKNANLLIAADCTAYAYANFHHKFIRNHITLIGCPKLDMTEYETKLSDILSYNDIKSLKIVRMEVPCCGGIEYAAKEALKRSGKLIPWQVVVISTDGNIIEE